MKIVNRCGKDETVGRVIDLAERIEYSQREVSLMIQRDGYSIASQGRPYVQLMVVRKDSITGRLGTGRSGRVYLSEHMTDSEIVQTIFGLIKGYEEHECREFFKLDGVAIYGPHIDYVALLEAAAHTDARLPPTSGE